MANQSLALLGKSEKIITGLLGLGLLGILYLIVYGNLAGNLGWSPESAAFVNESDLTGNIAFANQTGYTLINSSDIGAAGFTITALWGDGNQSNGSQLAIGRTPSGFTALIPAANYSVSAAGVVRNGTIFVYPNVSISGTYTRDSENKKNTDAVITNQTTGVVTFFGFSKTLFTLTAVTLLIGIVLVVIQLVKGKGGRKDDSSPGFSG